jgi:O-6-methylguanine DNA methyltransferase
MVEGVSVERRSYAVPGWGEGELWFGDGLVLANDFRFAAVPEPVRFSERAVARARPTDVGARMDPGARPPMGAESPPLGTVSGRSTQVGDDSVANARQRADRARPLDTDAVVDRLQAFLAGEAVELGDVPIDLSSTTPFQRAVVTALRKVPRGETVTYGELAALAGRPNAPRAAGTVCARNEFMFLVPCHRVVSAAGIGGYGSAGIGVKRRLLALEGVRL